MTKLLEQIEAMRVRMNELATEEHGIVRTLGEALIEADQRLVEEIRNVAAAHDARRGAILRELQILAQRMGALHNLQKPVAATLEDTSGEKQLGAEPGLNGVGGDWRQAAANLQDELAHHLKVRKG